ncbi:solute carrier family 2, facilitated glucose transporter member [Nesidiocoris tenuis]|uniref:Solute carrier family 2, facilitated glucose transporter member n=1 Tax=Nesidiocoris tenuis TaxID=355587 RepID=A0ABN7B0L9_9HEMI|nr:solute carrier family 2, facilitated glucose transporter member [Nesidiocoris tenuis]
MGIDREYLYKAWPGSNEKNPPAGKTPIAVNVGWTWRLALACISTTVGACIPVGYMLGVVNTPAAIIKEWCNETVAERYDVVLTESGVNVLWSAVVSIFLVGGMIGSLSGAFIANKIGRKGTMILGEACFLVAATLFFLSKPLGLIEFLFAGRLVAGLCSGLITAVTPMYLTELAPVTLQGATGVLCPMGLCFGVFFAQVMGLNSILGTVESWNILLSLYAILVMFSLVTLPWMSESPKYCDSIRKDRMRAIKELCKLRELPPEIVVHELDDVKNGDGQRERWSVLRLLKDRDLRLNLALVCALQAGQQLSGINAVFYYSTDIFENAGLSTPHAQYASLGASFLNFAIAVIMIPIVNHQPRRFMALLSTSLSTFWLVSLTIFILNMKTYSFMSYMSVVGVLCYVVCYGLGLGPIPYFIGTELFEVGPRPSAMALGSVCNWGGNFLVGMTFLVVQNAIGAYSFLIFAASTGLLTLFLLCCLHETNAKVLAEREN